MLFAFFRAEKILVYNSGLPKAPENLVDRRPCESEKPQNVQNYDIRFFFGGGGGLDSVLVTADLCVTFFTII